MEMTREEAIKDYIMPALKRTWRDDRCIEIISAIEQEPCADAISRQWLMECVNEGWIKFDTEKDKNRFIHLVRDMAPPVTPQEPTDKSNLEKICEELAAENDDLRDQLAMRDRFQKQEHCEDAISRQAVIEYIEGSEAELGHSSENELVCQDIKALPPVVQQPCEDCISRQAAKRALEDRFMELQKRHDDKRYETNYCLNTILELPPVNPQPICEEREKGECPYYAG